MCPRVREERVRPSERIAFEEEREEHGEDQGGKRLTMVDLQRSELIFVLFVALPDLILRGDDDGEEGDAQAREIHLHRLNGDERHAEKNDQQGEFDGRRGGFLVDQSFDEDEIGNGEDLGELIEVQMIELETEVGQGDGECADQ